MAICKYQRDYIRDFVLPKLSGNEMLELGDQVLNPYLAEEVGFNVAKPYYISLGYNHTSVDTNGNNGAIKHDLTNPRDEFNNKFNIITNHGTTEHVIDQYSVFNHLHDWGAEGCIYAHVVPLDAEEHKAILGRPFPKHGFWEYSIKFWIELAKACNYELISATTDVRNPAVKYPVNHYSSGAYRKTSDSKFIGKDEFNNIVKKHLTRCHI